MSLVACLPETDLVLPRTGDVIHCLRHDIGSVSKAGKGKVLVVAREYAGLMRVAVVDQVIDERKLPALSRGLYDLDE